MAINQIANSYSRINQLKRKGMLALTPDEKRELQSLQELARNGRQKPVGVDGVRLIMNRFENQCRGCGRKLIRGIEVRLDTTNSQVYCLACQPVRTEVKSIKMSPAELDSYLKN